MSEKVLEIKNLQQADSLADSLISSFTIFDIQRQKKIEEWKELRNYQFATDTTHTTNSKLPWKNKTTIPKLTQIRDNLHANYLAALLPTTSRWLKWEGHSQEAAVKNKAQVVNAYMDNKVREGGFREVVGRLLYDFIDYGNAFAEVVWVNEKKETEDGEDIPGYVGPKLKRVSPYDIIFNPTASSFKDSPVFVRYIMGLGELQGIVEAGGEGEYYQEALNKAQTYRESLSHFKREDINKAEGYTVDGFGSMEQYYQSGYVEIIKARGNFYDTESGQLLKDYEIWVLDRKWIVRKAKMSSWKKGHGVAHVGWRERPDNLYAMGPTDNLVGLQYRLDHLENLKADAMDLNVHPPLVVKGDVDPFTYGPFEEIRITDPDGSITKLPPDPAVFQVNNEIGYIMAMMEEMAGAPKEAMGIRSPGEKTAFEVQQLQNAAGRIFQDKITKFEIFLEEVMNLMLESARRNLDGADLIRVVDDELGLVDFLEITKEDISAAGKIRPIGARHFASQAQTIQNIVGLSNTALWPMVQPHLSSKALAQNIEEWLNLEQYDMFRDHVGIMEQAEQQKIINQAQQTIEEDEMTPGVLEDEAQPPVV